MTLDTNSQLVRSHALSVIQRVAMNKQGRRLVIQFLKDQVDRIISILGSGSPSPVSSILSSLSSYVSTQEELDEVIDATTLKLFRHFNNAHVFICN